jgi:hypothetical protein
VAVSKLTVCHLQQQQQQPHTVQAVNKALCPLFALPTVKQLRLSCACVNIHTDIVRRVVLMAPAWT